MIKCNINYSVILFCCVVADSHVEILALTRIVHLPKMSNEYGGGGANEFHVHYVDPIKISLGTWSVKLGSNLRQAEQHKNWSRCQDALNHLETVKQHVPNYQSVKTEITTLRDTYPRPPYLEDLDAGWSNTSTVTGMTKQEFTAGSTSKWSKWTK